MSHANKADKLLIKPAAGARPAPPCTRGQIIPKARMKAASHQTSHTRHGDNQAGDGPRQTDPPSLTDTRAALEEHAVTHHVFVTKLLGVVAPPCLNPLGNERKKV